MPCQSLTCPVVPVPRPSTKRPPDSSSRSRASVVSTIGERPKAYMIELPRRTCLVVAAIAASEMAAERS
jgi:hypothetical protein